jgi:hypothetical protein
MKYTFNVRDYYGKETTITVEANGSYEHAKKVARAQARKKGINRPMIKTRPTDPKPQRIQGYLIARRNDCPTNNKPTFNIFE